MHELLTPQQMYQADRLAIAAGTSGYALMQNAGKACVDVITDHITPCDTVVVCGPGNNGGDGFIVASQLAENGWDVRLLLVGEREDLKGDAAKAAADCPLECAPATASNLGQPGLIVDAMFGAGLARNIEGDLAALIAAMNAAPASRVAIDIPSGIHGETGEICGCAVEADLTITFFRAKPGHALLPGRVHVGQLHIQQIGIEASVLEEVQPQAWLNDPSIFHEALAAPSADSHKYARGHCLVCSGPALATGASRLAARAALRIGAGLVTLVGNEAALHEHAHHCTSIMLRPAASAKAFAAILQDPRITTCCIGPAFGVGHNTVEHVLAALETPVNLVLDADALTSFSGQIHVLSEAIAKRPEGAVILTPHHGEFRRMFRSVCEEGASKLEQARAAAQQSGATVVYKGADTVVATPDGRASINTNALPWLATAGSGDVLAGMCAGLLAQGATPFEAASAAVWCHGRAGQLAGRGLIADDLPDQLPQILQEHDAAG